MTSTTEDAKAPNQFPMAKGLLAKLFENASDEEMALMREELAQQLGLEPPLPEPEIAPGDGGRYARFRAECEVEIKKCEREIQRSPQPAHWYARQKEIEKIIALSKRADGIEPTLRRFICRRENARLHMYEMRPTIVFSRRAYETDDPMELARLEELMERKPSYLREVPQGYVALLTSSGEWDGVYSPEDARERLDRQISRLPHK